ncbi:MAG: hypothetical protein CMI18_08420 [Opitutaceae bacterium]|nr:hypothetical protein [Opitutaceae bacterium]
MRISQKIGSGNFRWFWPVALAVSIFFASGRTPLIATPGFLSQDKLAHFLVFGLLATLVIRCRDKTTWFWVWISLLITSVYGILDEWRQSFTPGRFVEWEDWAADTVGAMVAVLSYKTISKYSSVLETKLGSKTRQEADSENNGGL